MKKRISVIKKVEITHVVEIEVPSEQVLNEVVSTLECDMIEDFEDVILRINSVDDVEIESSEEEYDYTVDGIEVEVSDVD